MPVQEHIHHTDEAKTDTGIDNNIVIEHAREACDKAEAGLIDFIKGGQLDVAGMSMDLSEAANSLPEGDVLIWFTVREIKQAPAAEGEGAGEPAEA